MDVDTYLKARRRRGEWGHPAEVKRSIWFGTFGYVDFENPCWSFWNCGKNSFFQAWSPHGHVRISFEKRQIFDVAWREKVADILYSGFLSASLHTYEDILFDTSKIVIFRSVVGWKIKRDACQESKISRLYSVNSKLKTPVFNVKGTISPRSPT